MTIKKKATRESTGIESNIQDVIDQVISRGGKTTVDREEDQEFKKREKEVRFTLRLPSTLIQKIDEARKVRAGIVSRNQWILETIFKTVE